MSKLDFYKTETKKKTERIYMEVANELGLTYPKVVAIVRDGLFRFVKDIAFKEFKSIQIRGFGTFYISKKRLNNLNERKQKEYDGKRELKEADTITGV